MDASIHPVLVTIQIFVLRFDVAQDQLCKLQSNLFTVSPCAVTFLSLTRSVRTTQKILYNLRLASVTALLTSHVGGPRALSKTASPVYQCLLQWIGKRVLNE